MKKAVIVLPTYNEAGNIQELLTELIQTIKSIPNWDVDILVVDDESPDGTANIVRKQAKKYKNIYLVSGKKQGLGKAYVRGFKFALAKLQPYVLIEMDADLSHSPKLLPKMFKKIERGADMVIGARYIKGGSIPKDWGLHRKIFSLFGNFIIRFGFMNLAIHDWTNGYRAIKSWIIEALLPQMGKYSGYVFQIALLDKALKNGATIKEIPCKFKDRKKGVSKINAFEYITNILGYIFANSSFLKFVIVGLIGFAIDFGFAYLFINQLKINKPLANVLSAEIAIVSNFLLNNYWSFAHKKIKAGIFGYAKKFIIFNAVSSGSLVIQGGGMWVALLLFGDKVLNIFNLLAINSWVVYKVFIIACIIIPYSYFMYNRFIWKKISK